MFKFTGRSLHQFVSSLAACSLILAVPGAALAQPPKPPQPAQPAQPAKADSYTFVFQDADVLDAIAEVFGEIGVAYTVDPAVTGKISFRIDQRLTKAQLLTAFEAALGTRDIVLVRNGESLVVAPKNRAKAAAGVRMADEGAAPGIGYDVVAVPLSYAQPSEVAKALESIVGANGLVLPFDKQGLIVLGGGGAELQSTLKTLKIFDQSAFTDAKLRWFELQQASATTVAAEVERVIQGANMVGVAVVPLKRLNGIVVFGRSAQALEDIGRWVTRLDTPGKETASTVWTYRPRYKSAEVISKTLTSILGNGDGVAAETSGQTATPVVAKDSAGATTASTSSSLDRNSRSMFGEEGVRIGVDKESNVLFVISPPAFWVRAQRIIQEIDKAPKQVMIEASILEATLSNTFQFGVDWSVMSGDVAIRSATSASTTVGAKAPGGSITFLDGTISAAVNALGSKTYVEVISSPKIVVLNNKTARMQVGDQVPTVSQSAQSVTAGNAPLVSSIDYKNTGVILSVTPTIVGEGQISLEVNQEVSDVSRTATSGIDSPTIKQRRLESTLVLENGKIAALGGLINTSRSRGSTGVPGLKAVPVLGALFQAQGNDHTRTELIVLITAKIIEDKASADRALSNLFEDLKELQSRGLLKAQ